MEVRTKTIDQGLYGMDNIIIPKAIMYEDIYEESKIMFGSLFTEAVNNFADKIESNGKNTVIEQIEDRMRDRISENALAAEKMLSREKGVSSVKAEKAAAASDSGKNQKYRTVRIYQKNLR